MPKFILLLTGEGKYATFSPAEQEAAFKSFMEWTMELRNNGTLLDAERLAPEVRILQPGPSPVVTDGPFAESKEAIGGYFAISAKDRDEATKIASGCPHLKYGGFVQLRGVYEMN
jgi:hypothetical protein